LSEITRVTDRQTDRQRGKNYMYVEDGELACRPQAQRRDRER